MTENETLAARIEALEVRIAHQDLTIEQLNEAITGQWKEIEALNRQIARLGGELQEIRDGGAGATEPDPPPPHY